MKAALIALFACACAAMPGAALAAPSLETQFHDTVQPYVGKYCISCHSGTKPAAQFDIKFYDSIEKVRSDFPRWMLVTERLHAGEMPPKPMAQPDAEQTKRVVEWVAALRTSEIQRLAGDPGIVRERRLSNAEYDYTIRDLTGQDMRVARQFPVDPANTFGFSNSGESLTMSPALLNKYLLAARQVADHMVLKLDGIDFAPHTMLAETDRDRYSIQRILSFYAQQPTDYAKYFEAAWRFRHRAALGTPKATLASIAAEMNVSGKYLPMVWGILQDKDALGPVAKLQDMWNALPVPTARNLPLLQLSAVQTQTAAMRDFVTRIRSHTAMQFSALNVKGMQAQAQPLHYWRLQQYAESHRSSDPRALRTETDPEPKEVEVPDYPDLQQDASPRWAIISANARAGDKDLIVPAAKRAQYEAAFSRFASVFPDTFYVTERGRYWPDQSNDQGRLLSAGLHNVAGYYRDDTALMQLILDEKGQRQINQLWDDFDYVAKQTELSWRQAAPKRAAAGTTTITPVTNTSVIMAARDRTLATAAADPANDKDAPAAIRAHFARIDATLRRMERLQKGAEAKQLATLASFAERAWRRPLTTAERAELLAYYKTLRTENNLSHQEAVRDSIVGILMAPDFLYRFELSAAARAAADPKSAQAANARPFVSEPLGALGVANRLSYFLWSSMPDAELLKLAASGALKQPNVLRAQVRRMTKDPRISGLATEFTGNWLGFRQFESSNSVDRTRFPSFNDDLREAMFQEPIRFLQDGITQDRSVLDLLYANHTFVNPLLARHYGIPNVTGSADNWVRIDDAGKYNRGGILPMAVFMTQYSPGLRTSPVKRGNWVVQKVLGIRIPPPPPVVPELPSDEAKSNLSVRETLAQHRANPVCAACHARFDSFGLAFEGYGPVGEARTKDLAGRTVETLVSFPGGVEGTGLPGLKAFIRDHRQDQFVDSLSRKLLAYGLGRSLQMSDEGLIDEIKARLAANGYRFGALIETIATSPQFLNRRLPEKMPVRQAGLLPANLGAAAQPKKP